MVATAAMGAVVLESCATRGKCNIDAAGTGPVKAGGGCIGGGPTTMAGDASGAITGAALAGADCVGTVGTLGQLELGLSTAACTGTSAAAEETKSVMVCGGRTGAGDQVNNDGLTVEVEVSTSGADIDAGIDPGADAGVGADEGGACDAEAAVGNDQTEFAGASAPGAAFFAASAAAAAPNPFHAPIKGVGSPTGLFEGKDFSTSGAHLKTEAVAAGGEALDMGVSPGLEIEGYVLGAAVNDWFCLGNGDTNEGRDFSLLIDAGVPYVSRDLRCLGVADAIS